MELYSKSKLDYFKIQTPFFPHPYEQWKTDAHDINLELEKFADEIKDQKSFCARLEKAQTETDDITSFFPFLTELKLAKFLSKYNSIEFIQTQKKKPTPDLKLDNGIYIEINTALGQFFEIDYFEHNLKQIDARFRFKRRWGLSPFREGTIPSWPDLLPKLIDEIRKWKGKKLPSNPYIFWGNQENDHILAELYDEDKKILSDPDPDNANGRPSKIVPVSVYNRINSKLKKGTKLPANGLSNHRPNVIWFEMLYFSYEFLNNDWSKFDYAKIELPEGIDSIVFSVCAESANYDDLEFAHLLLNEKINPKEKLVIQNWADKLWEGWL